MTNGVSGMAEGATNAKGSVGERFFAALRMTRGRAEGPEGLLLVAPFQNIIDTDGIEIRQCAENRRRDHPLPAFIIGISALGHVNRFPNLFLRQIGILA